MRSNEFLKEAPRAQYSDADGVQGPAPGSVAAAQADAARIAQGQQNLNAIKRFFGGTPEELKDAPAGFSIDPYQRARMGYKPATQQEIAAYQAANPNYDKWVGRDGQPIRTPVSGGTLGAPGGQAAVVQAAQAAAPQTPGAAHIGMTPNVPTDVGRRPGEAQAGQGGTNYQPPADVQVPRTQRNLVDPEELNAEAERIAQLAGIGNAAGNVPYAQRAQVAPAEPAEPAAAEPEQAATGTGGLRPQDVGPSNVPPASQQPARPVTATAQVRPAGPVSAATTDPAQRIKRQSSGARKPWGSMKDKDGLQVYIDNDGGKWVWPPDGSSWKPANIVPGSDYVDKPLPTTSSSVTVKSGDTLSKIAAANGTTVKAIMAANPSIKDASKISVGQTVKLRESSSDIDRMKFLAGLIKN